MLWFLTRRFFMLSIQAYIKHVTSGAGPFWPQGHDLNKLGRGLLDDATYQISRLNVLWFQRRRVLHVFPISAYVKHVTPRQAHFSPGT